jgi:hypothetical protein
MSTVDDALLDMVEHTIHRIDHEPTTTRCGLELVAPYAKGSMHHLLASVLEAGSSVNLCTECYPEFAHGLAC